MKIQFIAAVLILATSAVNAQNIITAGETEERIENDSISTIKGVVRKRNTFIGVGGATVKLFSGNVLIATAVSTANGRFIINNVPPGSYLIRAEHDSYDTTQSLGIVCRYRDTLTLDLLVNPRPKKGVKLKEVKEN